MPEFKYVGQPITRVDAVDKVTGQNGLRIRSCFA